MFKKRHPDNDDMEFIEHLCLDIYIKPTPFKKAFTLENIKQVNSNKPVKREVGRSEKPDGESTLSRRQTLFSYLPAAEILEEKIQRRACSILLCVFCLYKLASCSIKQPLGK